MTIKQQKFIKFYIETGNATEAVWRSYDVKRRVIAAVMAKQLKKKPRIQVAIRLALNDRGLTILQAIRNIAYIADLNTTRKVSANAVLKANIELLKLHGAYG